MLPSFPHNKEEVLMSSKKVKAEIMDILDMYADLFWSNKENGATIDGLVTFEGVDGNHHAKEYQTMENLLLPNRGQAVRGEGWSSEHELYLEDGHLKNSHSPFSYPILLKRYKRYRYVKPEGGWKVGPPLTREIIQEIMSVDLTTAECQNIMRMFLSPLP
jgi:hypothetical protein